MAEVTIGNPNIVYKIGEIKPNQTTVQFPVDVKGFKYNVEIAASTLKDNTPKVIGSMIEKAIPALWTGAITGNPVSLKAVGDIKSIILQQLRDEQAGTTKRVPAKI